MPIDSRTNYPEIEAIKRKLRLEQERDDRLAFRKQNSEKHSNTKHKKIINDENFYQSREWRELRWKAIKKSDGKCVYCGRSRTSHGIVIHVDHIQPRSKRPDLALDINNLQITCEDCNLGKGTKKA